MNYWDSFQYVTGPEPVPDSWALEDGHQWQLVYGHFLDLAEQPHGQQGMPAQFKKVVLLLQLR